MLDTRSAPYPSPPRGTTHSQENYFEPFTPSTPRGMVAPQAWSSSLPSSPDSFVHVMPHTSPVSPIDYEFSRHYREDSSSDTSSTASIGSLSRHPSVSDENQLAGAPGVPIRCPRVDIAWHEPPMTSPTSMYGVPIPALHPDLYIASGAVAYEPQPADAHTQELLRSWRPVLDETRLLMGDASGRGNEVCAGERAHSGPQDASLDCYTPPTSYFAGSMYH
ncbi:hypothetical protein PYCCODRAFT_1156268 [Trametes coccinea BRFM310]|uniref:Uncharacterized protein n=1 Tax=Trametes coccinea (strain BRFM310) TaxID=1353009 RepID=A0A1Y2IWQ8_TRAC3|nr:hypothetical protein PYCCODRAFT_1156268 [Trametes coccinea BRFM310]